MNNWIASFLPSNLQHKKTLYILLILILCGTLARFYQLDAPWARKGHYNYGGVHMSRYAHCLKTTPLAESKAIPHGVCVEGAAPDDYYPNHPPTILFGLWGWTSVFGESEAAMRSFVALFSILNIVLVFLIASQMGCGPIGALFAATIQATMAGTIYFATHVDFVCEFSVFWTLWAALMALRGRIHAAGLLTLFAGVAAWPGYFGFAGLFVYQFLQKKKLWPVLLWGALGFLTGLGIMMWLHQTFNLLEFLKGKMGHAGYVEKRDYDVFYPLRWLYQSWQYQNMMLSPLYMLWLWLAGRAYFNKDNWRLRLAPLLAIAGGGLVNVIVGHEFVYIHEFNYLYLLPAYAVLIGWWVNSWQQQIKISSKWLWLGAFLIAATYSYGRMQTDFTLDLVNSLVIATSVFLGAYVWRAQQHLARRTLLLLAVGAFVNISQVINWRSEPTIDYKFCQWARAEFARTGLPVAAGVDWSFTRDYYCQGVPLRETAPTNSPANSPKE